MCPLAILLLLLGNQLLTKGLKYYNSNLHFHSFFVAEFPLEETVLFSLFSHTHTHTHAQLQDEVLPR